jgi:hypothetical protein
LSAPIKEQLAGLAKRERDLLLRNVEECIQRYGKVRNIQRQQAPDKDWPKERLEKWGEEWGEAKRGFEAALDLVRLKVPVPPLFQDVIATGASYHFFQGTPQAVVDELKKAFDEMADTGRRFLEELRSFLRETTPKGEPGRPSKYPPQLIGYIKKSRSGKPPTEWKEVLKACRERFPKVKYPKLDSFKRHMQRRIAE